MFKNGKCLVFVSLTLLLILFSLFFYKSFLRHETDSYASVEDAVMPSIPANTLRMLVWENYTPQYFIEEFKAEVLKKHNISLSIEITYAESSDDFFTAVRSGSVDLITITHDEIKDPKYDYINKGLLLPFDVDNMPNYKNLISGLNYASYHTQNGNVYGVPVANGPYGLIYNTAKFNAPPLSWNELWSPKHHQGYLVGKGQYIFNANITALALSYPVEKISSYDALNNDGFKKKLRELAINASGFWVGVDKSDELLGKSLATSWGDSLSGLERKGETWKMANPKEGTPWWIDDYLLTSALATRPTMKKIAEAWVNKILSSEFQIVHLLREVNIFPVIICPEAKLTSKEKLRINDSYYKDFLKNHILRNAPSQRDRNGLKLLWEEALEARNGN